MSKSEEWRAIEHTSGLYEVCNLGMVRSHKRLGRTNNRSVKPRLLNGNFHEKPQDGSKFKVTMSVFGEHMQFDVAALVWSAFVRDSKKQLPLRSGKFRYKDGDYTNCEVGNIELIHPKEYADELHLRQFAMAIQKRRDAKARERAAIKESAVENRVRPTVEALNGKVDQPFVEEQPIVTELPKQIRLIKAMGAELKSDQIAAILKVDADVVKAVLA